MSKTNIINCGNYNGLPLLTYNGFNPSYYETILDKIYKHLDDSLSRTSQVLLVRLVVKFPVTLNAHDDNKCFQHFMEEYRRSFGDKLLHYVWVREQQHSHNQHYHLILLLDGNKIRYFKHSSQAVNLWAKAINWFYSIKINAQGLIHICSGGYNGIPMNHGMMIHRNNLDIAQEAFKLCSYLAKVHTKGKTPKNIREYGASLIRHNNIKGN